MATKISWCNETWSPIVGCSKVSAGCTSCYAERMAIRLRGMGIEQYSFVLWAKHFEGAENKKGWNGKTVFVESALTKPLHWRKPRKIFVVSMGDLFHESVPFEWVDRIMAVAALCPQHTFMVLTKRAGRMREYFTESTPDRGMYLESDVRIRVDQHAAMMVHARQETDKPNYNMWSGVWPLSNVHLGVTVENQDNVGRIADLRKTPAAKRFVSFEPLLGNIYLPSEILDGIDYAFVGCESKGPESRLCSLHDIMCVLDQCEFGNVKNHVKQIPLNGRCNKNFNEWPLEFQIREA